MTVRRRRPRLAARQSQVVQSPDLSDRAAEQSRLTDCPVPNGDVALVKPAHTFLDETEYERMRPSPFGRTNPTEEIA